MPYCAIGMICNHLHQNMRMIILYRYYPYISNSKLNAAMKTMDKARFDARLSKEQKELFEYAAQLGGFRNLTDYVINVLMEKSTMIIEKHNLILASRTDQEIFFNAITSDIEPNSSLKSAVSKHNKLVK